MHVRSICIAETRRLKKEISYNTSSRDWIHLAERVSIRKLKWNGCLNQSRQEEILDFFLGGSSGSDPWDSPQVELIKKSPILRSQAQSLGLLAGTSLREHERSIIVRKFPHFAMETIQTLYYLMDLPTLGITLDVYNIYSSSLQVELLR